jgi:hypothetical protein
MVDNVAEEDDARLVPAPCPQTFHRGRGCRPGEPSRVAPIGPTSDFPFRPTIRRIYGFVETQPTRSSGASSPRRWQGGSSRTPIPTISPSCPSTEDSLEAQGTRWPLCGAVPAGDSRGCVSPRACRQPRGGGWEPPAEPVDAGLGMLPGTCHCKDHVYHSGGMKPMWSLDLR